MCSLDKTNPEAGNSLAGASLWDAVRVPGLTAAAGEILHMVDQVPKRLAVLSYKRRKDFLLAVFAGGTGTGKSTVFNALCGSEISETGVERPKTCGPIGYAHENTRVERDFPLESMKPVDMSFENLAPSACAGSAGQFVLVRHRRPALAHFVLVDTPDLDSLETRNREAVENLALLSDAVVFVTSLEKYADDVPFQFFCELHREGKPYFFLLNKAAGEITPGDVRAAFSVQGVVIPGNRFFVFPFVPGRPSVRLSEDAEFKRFEREFFETFPVGVLPRFLEEDRLRETRRAAKDIRLLIELLDDERKAAGQWLEQLDVFFDAACRRLFQDQEAHFSAESREYLQAEVRKHFSKYDLLGKPRRFVGQILRAPLRLLGLLESRPTDLHEDALQRIRRKMDLASIHSAVTNFNRSVLENLSPRDRNSKLYAGLRAPGMALDDEQIEKLVRDEQEELVSWLEETFQELARGIPKSKEVGIYSTSILWGGLILSLEVAVGGGITLLEVVLDTAIAPFVTKGAVELFAYQELKKIGKELIDRYKQGITSVVGVQRDRYARCLKEHSSSEETLGALKTLAGELERAGR